jgi:L-arabinose isomerase
MNKIDKRLADIPRYPELKIFKHGIQLIARYIANEYRSLMKVMIFVLDNLIDNETLNKKLLKVYEDWNNMYIMSRNEEFDDNDLKNFEVIIKIFIEIRKFFNIFKYHYYTIFEIF